MLAVLLPKRGREYYPRLREGMTLRRRGWMLGLVVAILIAAPAARAQQPAPEQKPAPRAKRFRIVVIEGVRGLFRSIFGGAQPTPQAACAASAPRAAAAAASVIARAGSRPRQLRGASRSRRHRSPAASAVPRRRSACTPRSPRATTPTRSR